MTIKELKQYINQLPNDSEVQTPFIVFNRQNGTYYPVKSIELYNNKDTPSVLNPVTIVINANF